MSFFETLADRIEATDSVVSVGLDPDPNRLPEFLANADLPRWAFNRRIIDATHEHAACYKPNAAFYEDADGWRALEETIAYAREGRAGPLRRQARRHRQHDPAVRRRARPRRRDHCEPVPRSRLPPTVPRPGGEGRVRPLSHLEPGRERPAGPRTRLRRAPYERVAALADVWNGNDNVGLVVGATAPEELAEVREIVPEIPFLVPGVGAQGGDAEAAVEHGLADRPDAAVDVGLVNSSRGIIFAGEESSRPDDEATYFGAAGDAAKRLKSG